MPESLDLSPTRVMCARHGEPFRPEWPIGYPQFVAMSAQALMGDKGFVSHVTRALGTTPGDNPETIAACHVLLDEAPVCCRLPRDILFEVYRQVQKSVSVWKVTTCSLCGKSRAGAEYRRTVPGIRADRKNGGPLTVPWPHVCLRCVVYGQDGR